MARAESKYSLNSRRSIARALVGGGASVAAHEARGAAP